MRARPLFRRSTATAAALTVVALIATGCATPANTSRSEKPTATATEVTIDDNHGKITVPVPPHRVVALDNTSMQTLNDWNIPLVAAPKGVMGSVWPKYIDDAAVLNIGNHREPDLEVVVGADPDLIIGGYRFSSYYDKLKAIQPTTIEINPREGKDTIAELSRQTKILGRIFRHEDEASTLVKRLDTAVANAKKGYDGTATVAGLIASGGKINYAAPHEGRGVGSLFDVLGLVPAIASSGSGNHQGDEISVEAIAAANPEWLIVLDRDGALKVDGYVSASELIEKSEALKNVPAVQKGQIVYLDKTFYLTEGIQAYTGLYADLAKAFAASKKR